MIRVICPNNNVPERRYAVEVIFNDLLDCGLTTSDIQFDSQAENYTVQVGDKQIVVEDHFFQKYPEPLSYLKEGSLPSKLAYLHAKGMEMPIIYGVDKYEETENAVTIGLDIFASTFFMLTRWEESMYGRDEKGDCSEKLLFTVKENIYQRPIVHEYESLLKGILKEWGIGIQERKYCVVMSHDVDGLVPPSWQKIANDFYIQTRYGMPANTVVHLSWQQKYCTNAHFLMAIAK